MFIETTFYLVLIADDDLGDDDDIDMLAEGTSDGLHQQSK